MSKISFTIFKHGQEIHRRLEILRVDVGRGHIPGLAAAFACERWIKGEGQESPLHHGLGVQAGALLLHRAEGPADGDGRQLTVSVLGDIHIRRQGDAIAIGERHLAVIHFVALGKGLIPFLGQIQRFGLHHSFFLPLHVLLRCNHLMCMVKKSFANWVEIRNGSPE